MLWIITGIIISYLIGSIPTAYIFGRLLKGIDIRKFGSGNVGATNAMRVLGKGPGITVLILDIFKGFLAVVFLGNLISSKIPDAPGILSVVLGLSCIIGHNWTIFLNFKGGKGLATTVGVLFGLALKIQGLIVILGLSVLVWAGVFIVSRIVSLASIISAICLPLLAIAFNQQKILIFACFIFSALTIWRHKSNIKRLLQGKEPRLSSKKSQK